MTLPRREVWGRYAAAVLLALVFVGRPANAAQPADIFVQEIGDCAVRRGTGSLEHDPSPYQPCRPPVINELLIRKFADGSVGFRADHTQFASTTSNCTLSGLGRLSAEGLVGSVFESDFRQKNPPAICEVVLEWSADYSSFRFHEKTSCSGLCGFNHTVNSVTFSSPPRAVFSPSFECAKSVQPAEKTICMVWDLSELDFQLAEIFNTVQNDLPAQQTAQRQWLRKRNSCGFDAACIEAALRERIAALCDAGGSHATACGSRKSPSLQRKKTQS